MVHIGSFVPAESVKMSLLDNIHTRIKTLESVSTEVSTFLIDLRQVKKQSNIMRTYKINFELFRWLML